ncbi:MAG TPA: hypothetical protein VF250_15690 [Conexibacter sp.]
MERRLTGLLCLLGIAGLLLGATASAAEPVFPLGTDGQGMRLTAKPVGYPPHRHKDLFLTFDASAAERYREIAGRMLLVSCVRFDRHPRVFQFNAGAASEQRAPRGPQPIAVLIGRRYDVCKVDVRHGRGVTTLGRIPLTPLGAERLDEFYVSEAVVTAARLLARPARPSAASVAALRHGVVLDAPAQTPPPGTLGVWSDGAQHAYAAQVTRAGKLLFVDLDGGVTRTNVADYLFDRDPLGIE